MLKEFDYKEKWKSEALPIYKELHSLCSYLAMFPPHVPAEYIEKYTKEGDLVYEPFSGRGTTTLEAIRLGRRTISNDLSPLAYVITKSKAKRVKTEDVVKRVLELKTKYKNWIKNNNIKITNKIFNDISVFYSSKNIKQLLFIRENLGKNFKELDDVDNYILAVSLGIMHGQTRKDGSSLYFSVSMPNGYSMSPNYANRYIAKNNLKKIETDIFEQIIVRAEKKPNWFENDLEQYVNYGNALNSSEFVNEVPKLIFTSPPYLNIVKYVEQNWIRFWLLGYNKDEINNSKMVDDHHKIDKYKEFLIDFLKEMEKIMDKESVLMLVIGDVNNFKICKILKDVLKSTNLLEKEKPIPQKLRRKLSSSMGERAGKATPTDWIFTLKLK